MKFRGLFDSKEPAPHNELVVVVTAARIVVVATDLLSSAIFATHDNLPLEFGHDP